MSPVGPRPGSEAQAVGAHVGDEPRRAAARNFDALVKRLCDAHRAARREAAAARSLLLERAGLEGRVRLALALLRSEVVDDEPPRAYRGLGLVRLVFAAYRHGLALEFFYAELVAALRVEARCRHVEQPVFLGDEAFNLFLALADYAQRDGLHAPGGKAALHLVPEQRAELVADEAVEHAARLLRLDEVHVYHVGLGYRAFDAVARDFVHSYAALFICVDVEQRREVPRYRLALAVGVGGEQRSGARRRSALERLYEVGLAAHLYVLGLEAVLDVYRHAPLRKVAHVAYAREHAVFRAEYLFERLCLRGGLDYDERLSLVL